MDCRYWMAAAACCTLLCAGAMAAYVTHSDGHDGSSSSSSSILQDYHDYAQRAFADAGDGQPLPSSETGLEPPRKQTEAGVMPHDVMCSAHHVLAIRVSQEPVCVTPGTAEILAERGIIESVIGPSTATAGTASDEAGRAQGGVGAGAGESRGAPLGDGHGTYLGADNSTSGVAVSGSGGAITDSNATTGAVDAVEGLEEAGAQTPHVGQNSTNSTVAGPESGAVAEPATNSSSSSSSSASSTTAETDEQERRSAHQGSVSTIPASSSTVLNFYVTDDDLNVASNAAETIPTEGLLKFAINGIPIEGPDTMTETGPDTGQFHVRLELPPTIDGRPITHNDVVDVTYIDQAGRSGESQSVTKSFTLSSTYAHMQSEGDGKKRIGHEFTLRIYEPDANTDSKEENRIPLNRFEFRSEGGIRVTLDHGAFDANRSHMVETGPNTGTFEVTIKIPRQIDGKVIHIGDWYEITYYDSSTPSGTSEEIVLRGEIGV
ncbi:MAG: hypothetical protein OXI27_03425 [Thaumarchaeota archaeon]|nr:hypothetical protein [Nitrososphaerota archaeon]